MDSSKNCWLPLDGTILTSLPYTTTLQTPKNDLLAVDFEPGPYDVICARGKQVWDHVGNRRFRLLIDLSIDRYMKARTRMDKSIMVFGLVDMIRQASLTGGGFVRRIKCNGKMNWCEVGDITARDKVGHAIRDAIWARQTNGGQVKTMLELFGASDVKRNTSEEEQAREGLAQAAVKQVHFGYQGSHYNAMPQEQLCADSQIMTIVPIIPTKLYNYEDQKTSPNYVAPASERDHK